MKYLTFQAVMIMDKSDFTCKDCKFFDYEKEFNASWCYLPEAQTKYGPVPVRGTGCEMKQLHVRKD